MSSSKDNPTASLPSSLAAASRYKGSAEEYEFQKYLIAHAYLDQGRKDTATYFAKRNLNITRYAPLYLQVMTHMIVVKATKHEGEARKYQEAAEKLWEEAKESAQSGEEIAKLEKVRVELEEVREVIGGEKYSGEGKGKDASDKNDQGGKEKIGEPAVPRKKRKMDLYMGGSRFGPDGWNKY